MLACVYGAYLIVGSVIDHRVALIQKYIYGIYIYIWKCLVYCFHIYLAILDIELRAQIYPSVHITVRLG